MAFPKQTEIGISLLQEIEAMGGEAKFGEELVQKVAAYFPQLTEADIKEKRKSGANKWYNDVAWTRLQLVMSQFSCKSS